MRADPYPGRAGGPYGFTHGCRITGMKPQGDVGGGYQLEESGVFGKTGGPGPFADVGVDVDREGQAVTSSFSWSCPRCRSALLLPPPSLLPRPRIHPGRASAG